MSQNNEAIGIISAQKENTAVLRLVLAELKKLNALLVEDDEGEEYQVPSEPWLATRSHHPQDLALIKDLARTMQAGLQPDDNDSEEAGGHYPHAARG